MIWLMLPAAACATVLMGQEPSPALTPAEVVRTQITALKNNDKPRKDAGIATAFRFASPGNRAATGPLDRFILMVKGPLYRPLIDFRTVEYGEMEVKGDAARQIVRVTEGDGKTAVYLFTLTKQKDAPYKDCWMTDGVMRVADQAGPAKIAGMALKRSTCAFTRRALSSSDSLPPCRSSTQS